MMVNFPAEPPRQPSMVLPEAEPLELCPLIPLLLELWPLVLGLLELWPLIDPALLPDCVLGVLLVDGLLDD